MKTTKLFLEDLKPLVEQELSDYKIAKILSVNHCSVWLARKRLKLNRRNLTISQSTIPTQRQLEVLVGTLLGDSSLRIDGKINPSFSCSHGINQKQYCKWKFQELESLGMKLTYHKRKIPDKRNGIYYEDYTIIGKANPEYINLYKNLYISGKKRITKDFLYNFSVLSLAVLFMDDGSKTSKGSILISTNCFPEDDLVLFTNFLKDKFNLEFSIQSNNSIYLLKKDFNKFKELIQTNIEKSMLYKLGLLIPLIAGTSKEDYQQPSSCGDTEKGSTTSSESQVDNNSTTKAEHPGINCKPFTIILEENWMKI